VASPRSPRVGRLKKKATELRPADQSEKSFGAKSSKDNMSTKTDRAIEVEDVELLDLWKSTETPDVPDFFEDVPTLNIVTEKELLKSEIVSDIFATDSVDLKVAVSRIPEEVVAKKKAEMEAQAAEDRHIVLEKIRKKELDMQSREETAKDNLMEREALARARLDAEKQKIASMAMQRQRNLAQDFRKVREELEAGIKRQEGTMKEHFGKLLIHEEVCGWFAVE
jgi:hypothetical protein